MSATIPDLVFPAEYWERANKSIAQYIETNWDEWTKSPKRFMLVTKRCVIENDLEQRTGLVTGRLDFHVSADAIEDIRRLWAWLPLPLDTTYQHFIVDTQERKVVGLLSICA